MPSRLAALLRELMLYLLTLAVGVVTLFLSLGLDAANPRIPLYYNEDGDTNFSIEMIRATIEHGWYFTDPNLGAPGTMDLHDFPMLDALHFVAFKLLGYASDDPFLVLNIYHLGGYLVCILTGLVVLRHFGITPLVAAGASLLFAFQNYHFMRGSWHLFLASYATIPLAIMVVLWVARGEPFFFARATPGWWPRPTAKGIAACGIIGLIATTGVYYAYFTGFLLVVAGLIHLAHQPTRKGGMEAVLLAGLLVGLVVAQALPFLWYRHVHGRNSLVAARTMDEVREGSLEIPYLVGPPPGHPLLHLDLTRRLIPDKLLKAFTISPGDSLPEGRLCSIGTIAGCGYVMLLLSMLGLRSRLVQRIPYLGELAELNFAATLLAVQGGLGLLIAYAGFREIRAYNRINIFLAFLALFAVASATDCLIRSRQNRSSRVWLRLALVGLIPLGLYDQIPVGYRPDHAHTASDFRSDRQFVRAIEANVPPRAMILQLPFIDFPEGSPTHKLVGYALLRPTFHSRQLHWSAGTIKGRPTSTQIQQLCRQDPVTLIADARKLGFAGIVVHRRGFEDEGKALEQAIGTAGTAEPVVSENRELSFFRLDPS